MQFKDETTERKVTCEGEEDGAMRGQYLLCVISSLLVTFSAQGGYGTTVGTTSQTTLLPASTITTDNSATTMTTTLANNDVTTNNNVTTNPDNNNNQTTTLANNVTADNNVTTNPDNNNVTTAAATNNPNVTSNSSNISTTSNPASCANSPCGNNSVCQQLSDSYICRCQLNFYYNDTERSCRQGESFFGDLLVTMTYNPDTSSSEYAAIYNYVLSNFKACFTNVSGYQETVILDIQPSSSSAQRQKTRNTDNISIKVLQIFTPGTTTASAVSSTIQNYIEKESSFGKYTEKTICSGGFYCDAETTTCTMSTDGQSALCTCTDGHYSSIPVYTSCRDCDPSCGKFEGQYCKQSNRSLPICACQAGYKAAGTNCTKCDFGFSGENCTDNFLLILVIVGSVLGAAVIILLGAVIGVSVRSQKGKRDNEQTQLITKADKVPGEESPVPRSLFPKVRAKPDLGQVNNVFEENESYARTVPDQDYDENPWYEMSRNNRRY